MIERLDEILLLFYRYRFLTRIQLQALLGHKYHKRVLLWLNELTNEKYLNKYWNQHNVTEPSLYSLGVVGRKYLLANLGNKVSDSVLNRIWPEPKSSNQFKKHCMFVSHCSLSLQQLVTTTNATLHFFTKVDLNSIEHLIKPLPDAYFSITEASGSRKGFFLDVFDDLPPRMLLRKRIKQYWLYYQSDEWQENNTHPFPNIILICPDLRSFNYLKRYIYTSIEPADDLHFYLSLRNNIQTQGICKNVLTLVDKNETDG